MPDQKTENIILAVTGVMVAIALIALAIYAPEPRPLPTCLEYEEYTRTTAGEIINLPMYFLTGSFAMGLATADRKIVTSTSTRCKKWSNPQ